jgi:hypothetical protein
MLYKRAGAGGCATVESAVYGRVNEVFLFVLFFSGVRRVCTRVVCMC